MMKQVIISLFLAQTQTIKLTDEPLSEHVALQMSDLLMPEVDESNPEYFSTMTLRFWKSLPNDEALSAYQRAEYRVKELLDEKTHLKNQLDNASSGLERASDTLEDVNSEIAELESQLREYENPETYFEAREKRIEEIYGEQVDRMMEEQEKQKAEQKKKDEEEEAID